MIERQRMKSFNMGLSLLALLFVPVWTAEGLAQPRLVANSPASYVAGSQVDPASTVADRDMKSVRLTELIKPESKVVVLVLFDVLPDA